MLKFPWFTAWNFHIDSFDVWPTTKEIGSFERGAVIVIALGNRELHVQWKFVRHVECVPTLLSVEFIYSADCRGLRILQIRIFQFNRKNSFLLMRTRYDVSNSLVYLIIWLNNYKRTCLFEHTARIHFRRIAHFKTKAVQHRAVRARRVHRYWWMANWSQTKKNMVLATFALRRGFHVSS